MREYVPYDAHVARSPFQKSGIVTLQIDQFVRQNEQQLPHIVQLPTHCTGGGVNQPLDGRCAMRYARDAWKANMVDAISHSIVERMPELGGALGIDDQAMRLFELDEGDAVERAVNGALAEARQVDWPSQWMQYYSHTIVNGGPCCVVTLSDLSPSL